MLSATYDDPDSRPYGPGNPDYEHDGRDDDGEAEEDLQRQQEQQESQQ